MMMPGRLIFHDRRPLALNGIGNDDRRLVLGIFCFYKCLLQSINIISIGNIYDMPAETCETVMQVFMTHDIFRITGDLQVITVDDCTKIVQMILVCRHKGYGLKTLQVYENTDDLTQVVEELRICGCVGIILLGTELSAGICRRFLEASLPMVLLDASFDAIDCSSVLINNVQGTYLATGYLIDRCNEQPGHLCSSYSIANFSERKTGFQKAVREHGMSVSKSLSHELAPSIEGAFSDMLEIIDSGTPLAKCYFADNDLIAIGAIKALKLRGYKIPDDIAIIGFDNISEGRILDPSLTTIDIPRRFMGQTAVDQLIRQMEDPASHTVKLQISTSLIKRFSV